MLLLWKNDCFTEKCQRTYERKASTVPQVSEFWFSFYLGAKFIKIFTQSCTGILIHSQIFSRFQFVQIIELSISWFVKIGQNAFVRLGIVVADWSYKQRFENLVKVQYLKVIIIIHNDHHSSSLSTLSFFIIIIIIHHSSSSWS